MIESKDNNGFKIKLIDFGTSRQLPDDQKFTKKVGNFVYRAPEMIKVGQYDEKVDIWAATVCVLMMLTGDQPFKGDSEEEFEEQILNCDLDLDGPEYLGLSKDAKAFIKFGMSKNPTNRGSAQNMLNHPWLSKPIRDQRRRSIRIS